MKAIVKQVFEPIELTIKFEMLEELQSRNRVLLKSTLMVM